MTREDMLNPKIQLYISGHNTHKQTQMMVEIHAQSNQLLIWRLTICRICTQLVVGVTSICDNYL